jgi:hypothetical protein
MDIAAWLHGLGLERYVPAFRDNAIDLEILPELTEADLEKLGVLLGDRKRMLRAIAALGAAAPGRSRSSACGGGRAPAADGDVLRSS